MNIYVASSWRNNFQPVVVEKLRNEGYTVYDYKQNATSFHWSQIDENWKDWKPIDFRMHLENHHAAKGFTADMQALRDCDACVLVLPCGKSAHTEMGYAVGAGKKTILFAPQQYPIEPELMYAMFDHFCVSMGEVLAALNDTATPRKR